MGISFDEALSIALNKIEKKDDYETININNALNRVLFEDIKAIKNLPPYNNSAMDGYGFNFEDRDKRLKIVKKIYAGDVVEAILNKGECYKIMTGAKVPSDVDTIIPYENIKKEGAYIEILDDKLKKGSAIRLKGEELKSKDTILNRGELLDYAKIALLASQGIVEVKVFKKVKIAIISGGNELKEPWEEASENEIYNINAININMLLKSFSFESDYLGKLSDNLEEIESLIDKLSSYDLIITSGGISGGDADFTKKAFLYKGLKEFFHGIRVKPGHPTMFGKMNNSYVLALPGNPLAAILNMYILGLPIVAKLSGLKKFKFKTCQVKMGVDLKLKSGRTNLVLGNIKDNIFYPYKNNKYGSGMISPLVNSEVLAIFKEDQEFIKESDHIEVLYIK